ncbi:WD40 repeat domain-containing protein [Paraliomyxa miuraensis]|uniref:WD40 repeat domain-containing protein n=1 Tax=Paraliomyxa miuraensis TaxID=376150 RepID=UPI00225888E2|nr:hypothetical protein [Paraliomyxa miuraensis]MCX4245383.1 hypothetical protein [Paraliomyxa miuraensis]
MVPSLLEVEALVGRTKHQWALDGGTAGALLGHILERNRSVLERYPDLVLPCVVRLGGWEEPLRDTIEAWCAQWRQQGRGAWLRSLRPPVLGLDAPVLAEFAVEHAKGRPWFSDDERLVGLRLPEHVAAWDRASGARVPDIRPPPQPQARYSIDQQKTSFGRLVLLDARSGRTLTLTPGPEDQLRRLAELPSGDVLAGGWFDDDDGVVLRLDPGTGTIRWRAETESSVDHLEPSTDGSRIFVHAGTHYILDGVTGRILAHLPNERGPAALSPSGHAMAALDGPILRVWDVTDPRSQERRQGRGTAGLVDARFSARGSLLLCGHTLCNGRSGEVIAVLPLESTGYLEGGPAPGCTEVLEDGVIEAQVFRGLSRWNARGEHQWSNPKRRYGLHSHCSLAFAPDGECYAVLDHRSPSIAVLRVDDGGVLRELKPATVKWGDRIAFSLDGARLAWCSRELEMVWDVASGECLGQRPVVGVDDGRRGFPHGWQGFREREHELSGRFQAGVFEVLGPGGADVLARIPCEEPLVASPDGTRWASRRNHFALEGH